jgi:glutamate N-acetyltransferase/amino-acid N-acetyltransferase
VTGTAGCSTGVTAPSGFLASGVHCGIRNHKPDVALVVSDRAAGAAGVFTTNAVKAAPVLYTQEALRRSGGRARAIVVNSGNANACTGEEGDRAARWMADQTGVRLGIPAGEVLVASTGVIGVPLPLAKLGEGIAEAAASLSPDGGPGAARAILTTDTRIKESARRIESPQGGYLIGGMAKGSGMIHPDLATTLAFVTTDAEVEPPILADALRKAADRSFNRVTVDGDTSTNDMIAVLANGASGVGIEPGDPVFEEALTEVLVDLAREVARDGEGATRLITVRVTGANTEHDALAVARTIASSPLVKTAVHGADANWGRVVAAAGRAGVAVDGERMTLRFGGIEVLSPGYHSEYSEGLATEGLSETEVEIWLDLGMGDAEAAVWTCDLSRGYVDINAGYRT